VFDGLSSHAHGLGHAVEPVLHPVDSAGVPQLPGAAAAVVPLHLAK
jgi:hypothetical protein